MLSATRYPPPVQRGRWYLVAVAVVSAASVLAACGSGGLTPSAGAGGNSRTPCGLISRLDAVAAGVRSAPVADPVAFKRTLDDAVTRYRDTLRQLRTVAPPAVGASLDQVEADVSQYRFDAAHTDAAALDEYALRTCNRPIPGAVTSTTAPPVSAP